MYNIRLLIFDLYAINISFKINLKVAQTRNPDIDRKNIYIKHLYPTVPTCAVRETASLGIMGAPRVPPLNPSETIVLSEIDHKNESQSCTNAQSGKFTAHRKN